jgi:hypothetical protein
VKSLPDEFFSIDDIQSGAFDLMTSTLELIMQQVKYLATSRGGLEIDHSELTALGRIAKQLTTNNQKEYESAREALQRAVREYDRALDQGHRKMDAMNLSVTKMNLSVTKSKKSISEKS